MAIKSRSILDRRGSVGAGGSRGFTIVELVIVMAILVVLASLAIMNFSGQEDRAELTVARATMQTVRDAVAGTAAAPGYLADMKYVPGFHIADLRIHDLLAPSSYPAFAAFDPQTSRGWRGPYLQSVQSVRNTNVARNGLFPAAVERRWEGDRTFQERGFHYDSSSSFYGIVNDRVVADPWGNPVVLQVPPPEAFVSASDARRFQYARLVSAGPDGILDTPRDRLAGMLADGTSQARGDDLVLFLNRADTYETEEP